MREAELVVIGAGPAGIAAATEAARRNVSVVVIDETRGLGGKVLKNEEGGLKIRHTDAIEADIVRRLQAEFQGVADKVTLYLNTEVWNVDDHKMVETYSPDDPASQVKRIQSQKLIIAAGAFERVIPFPGWTQPGVFTVGGLNALVKKGVLPGKNFLVAGSGPLLLVLAKNLIAAGADISAIVEAASLRGIARKAHHILLGAGMPRLRQGINYLRAISAHDIPIYRSHIVCQAMGNHEVSAVKITKVDSAWQPIAGTQKTFPVDTVAVGYGLVPSVELSRICGCRHSFDDRLGYWSVDRNESMETTISGIFAAGDGAQIKGYQAAIDEGRIAGMAVCAQLGKLSSDEAGGLIRPLQSKLKRAKQFGEALDAISAPRPGILDSIADDTIVCRCEEVKLAGLKRAIAAGAADINDIKRRTRLGMGHCQGRFCGQIINELLWKLSGEALPREVFTPRIPAKPVPFGALME